MINKKNSMEEIPILDSDKGKFRRKRILNYYWHKIFPKRQPTGKVRLSVFLGIFIGVMPTIGIAIILTIILCKALKLPITPGVMSSFVAIPPTQFLFFYPVSYEIGLYVLEPAKIDFDFLAKLKEINFSNAIDLIGSLWHVASGHVMSFMLGITIVALVTAYIGYFIAHFIMTSRRKKYKEWQTLRQKKSAVMKKILHKKGAENGEDTSV